MNRPLPIGSEDFKELIGNEYYYVDKTLLIKELLDNRSKVSLFMRPAPYDGIAVIIEIKVADTLAELDRAAEKALEKMEERQYDAELRLEGYHTFILYGIAFYKKLCKILVEK